MEASIPSSENDEDEEEFQEAFDEFPFYDCTADFDDDDVSSIHSNDEHKPLPATLLRRRHSLLNRTGDSAEPRSPSYSTSFDNYRNLNKTKLEFSPTVMENGNVSEITGESVLRNDDSDENVSNLNENEDWNSNCFLFLAGSVVKGILFQVNLLIKSVTFPIWSIYTVCMLVMDPFGIMRRVKSYIIRNLLRKFWGFVRASVSPFISERLKDYKSIWKLGLKCGWGVLWSVYVCVVLIGLLMVAFMMGGLVIRGIVEEPVRIKEPLNFNFVEKSPVAYVPLVVCPKEDCGGDCMENVRAGKKIGGAARVVPTNHKLKVTVSLKLPESVYNRNLGIFQVKLDFLTADGRTLASSWRPCMLQFKSNPIHLLSTFLKIAPLVTGYTSESQNIHINFRGFTEGKTPTACLRINIEQRAEFQNGAGIPQIYSASLTLESELPLLKRIMWYWKKTLFVWVSLTLFIMELLFALLCCRPLVIPTLKVRENPPNNNAQPDNHLVQR